MKDKNLLIMIDDDTDDHEIFNMALGEIEKPLKCLFFPDCEHAIAHFHDPNVDTPGLVFVDLNLPRIDGKECLLDLQKISKFDHPRMVIYSGSVPSHFKQDLEEIGVDKFLEKSGLISVLVEQIKELLE